MRIGLLALVLGSMAPAANFSFSGTFTQDDEVQFFNFVVASTSDITFLTYSYAGGVNSAGAVIARGGFDPILSVYDSNGIRIGSNDDGGSSVPSDISGQAYDTFLALTLGPGTYSVAISQYDNSGPADLNGGTFSQAGTGNFTSTFANPAPCSRFCDVSGSLANFVRDGHWAFDILNVDTATQVNTPEPSSLALIAVGLALLRLGRRRRI